MEGGAMPTTDQPPTERGTMALAISNAVVRLTREYTGRGPTKARTLLADTLTKGERALVERGERDLVYEMRRAFQRAMRDDLCAAVEMITERQVIAFFSDTHIDPDMAIESFVLAPQVSDNPEQPSS